MVKLDADDEIYLTAYFEFIHDSIKAKIEKEYRDNIELLRFYSLFIKEASTLVNDIALKDNSISKAFIIQQLILLGAFSYNSFNIGNCFDMFIFKPGIEIVLGRGCCRHFAGIAKDIFDVNGDYCDLFSCLTSKEKRINEKLSSDGNHCINIFQYNGKYCGYDIHNDTLLDFIGMNELINKDKGIFMYYKPEILMHTGLMGLKDILERLERYQSSVGFHVSLNELNAIEKQTIEKASNRMSEIMSFNKDTAKLKQKIYLLSQNKK